MSSPRGTRTPRKGAGSALAPASLGLLSRELARELESHLGKGFGERTPRRRRLFDLTCPKGVALPAELGEAPIRTAPLSRSSGWKIRRASLSRSAAASCPEPNGEFLARRYQMYLPTEAELRAELARDRKRAERALQAIAEPTAARQSKKGTR